MPAEVPEGVCLVRRYLLKSIAVRRRHRCFCILAPGIVMRTELVFWLSESVSRGGARALGSCTEEECMDRRERWCSFKWSH